jgi:putative drug exporter of the RND superfamily
MNADKHAVQEQGMLTHLGRFAVRRRRPILVGTGIFFVLAILLGGGVADSLTTGGFEDPNSESHKAAELLEDEFGTSDPNLLLLVTAEDGNVDSPRVAAAGTALTEELAAEPGISEVVSYWTLPGATPLRSTDESQALVLAVIEGNDDTVDDGVAELGPEYTRETDVITVGVGGQAEVFRQVGEQIEEDLLRAELIAIPITLILLIFVFRGLIAATLPLAVGVLAIVGTFVVLTGIAAVTEVSVYSLNLTTAMGLGLAIDYSLFIVSRFREELRRGLSTEDAVVRTVETAGRTVLFSAVTVAISLAALVIFPLAFLRSFAYAGVAVSLVTAVGAVVSLPALLAVIGPRVNSLSLWRRPEKADDEGVWHRVATFVMRRPIPVATIVIAFLLFLGIPFLHVEFGIPDDRVLPDHLSSRQVQDDLRTNFNSNEASALQVVAPDVDDPTSAEVVAYAARLSQLDGAARVDAAPGSFIDGEAVPVDPALSERFVGDGATWLSVAPDIEPISAEGEQLAQDVRDADAPFEVLVGGRSAELFDSKASLFGRLPLALLWIALATFILLFLMFGSVVVPLKALVINVLSLSATFGAMVWIFQDGHLSGLLDFTPTGNLAATMPILMFCVAFGLSMDYEVFLLSRIKEEHDRSGDNTASVALGLERTGRIVTAAALLISVVFLAFATSGVMFIKLFGLGLAVAVLLDAFVIRATLVPAFMRIAGELNWWAPRWMKRIYERFGISESESALPPPTPPEPPDRAREPIGI